MCSIKNLKLSPRRKCKRSRGGWFGKRNPLLSEAKPDMRLHLFVRLNPLRIYIHQDSVVRLASAKYVANGKLANKCMHITNQAYQ